MIPSQRYLNHLEIMEKHSALGVGYSFRLSIHKMSHVCMTAGQHEAIFEMLTDDVLLEIFDWYRQTSMEQCNGTWELNQWIILVHVCRRWRNIVFDSSRRLDLWLLCTYGTPDVRKRLDCWPSLPILIKYWPNSEFEPFKPPSREDEDNLIAALEHPDRVHAIQLAMTSSLWEKVAERMRVPFPALTSLSLWLDPGTAPSHPTEFLARVASPCLKDISLVGIPCPRTWGLLTSTNDLVAIRILEVPSTGYIDPDMMATYLSMLPHLKLLCIDFHSPPSHHYNRGHKRTTTLVTRASLPSLTHFNFRGTNEYLKDFVSRIDASFLNKVNIINEVNFNVPHLSRSIDQMEMPKSVNSATPGVLGYTLSLRIIWAELGWQTSCLTAPFFSNVEEHLEIRADCIRKEKETDSIAWLEFFYSFFSAVRLRISGELAPQHVAPALDGVNEEMTRQVLSRNCVCSCSSFVENPHRLNTLSPPARSRADL
jgi:hypothetical protein